MNTGRYMEAQIFAILQQARGGVPVGELCREHGMSNASFYTWRATYGGMDACLVGQMKASEDVNRRLKRMYADRSNHAELVHCEGERHWSERTGAGSREKDAASLDLRKFSSSLLSATLAIKETGCGLRAVVAYDRAARLVSGCGGACSHGMSSEP